MHRNCPPFLVFLIPLIGAPALAAAQGWDSPWSDPRDRPARIDLSLSGGYLMSSDWSDLVVLGSVSSTSGALEQVLAPEFQVERGPVLGGSFSYSKTRYGLRVNLARSASSLNSSGVNIVDVKSWFYDVRGTIGLVDYTPTRPVLPYLFVGVGGITYDFARTVSPPQSPFLAHLPAAQQANLIVLDRSRRPFVLEVDEFGRENVLALNFGIGTNIRIPLNDGAVGVRLELLDHVSPAPLGVRIHELNSFNPASSVPIRSGARHHLRAAAGLIVQFGR